MYKTQISVMAIALAAAACFISPEARADVKVVETTTTDSPEMKKMLAAMPPNMRAEMAKPEMAMFYGGTFTTIQSISGAKYRIDIPLMVLIFDAAAKEMITLDPKRHTYDSRRFDIEPAIGNTTSIHDTRQTKMILGHKSHHYIMTVTTSAPGGDSVRADIWAAPDLPQPPSLNRMSGGVGMVMDEMKSIKGMPLITRMSISRSDPATSFTVTKVVKSISTKKLPASEFAIPPGYTDGSPVKKQVR